MGYEDEDYNNPDDFVGDIPPEGGASNMCFCFPQEAPTKGPTEGETEVEEEEDEDSGKPAWSTGIFSCCLYPISSCYAASCACCAASYMSKPLDLGGSHGMMGFVTMLCATEVACQLTNALCDCPCGRLYVAPCWYNALTVRAEEKYGLPPPMPFGHSMDICVGSGKVKHGCGPQVICCGPCTFCMVYREVKLREARRRKAATSVEYY